MDDLLGMCCTSAVPRFGEALPHSAASHVAREKVPTYIASSANTAGKAGICCFSLRAGPHFSAPLIPGGPARLSDRWWQVCNNTFFLSVLFYLPQARALSPQALPSQPPIWDQSATGDHGLGSSDCPSP